MCSHLRRLSSLIVFELQEKVGSPADFRGKVALIESCSASRLLIYCYRDLRLANRIRSI